jgi:hypothetical protein
MQSFLGTGIPNSLYNRMTTLMIYKGAADIKTDADNAADNPTNARLKLLLYGTNRKAKDPAAVREIVRERFSGPLASRVRVTIAAIRQEHTRSNRPGEPQPTEQQVKESALRQLFDVMEYIVGNMRERNDD